VQGQDHPFGMNSADGSVLDRDGLEGLTDEQLEAELTIAAYAPGHLRWERYQRLLLERLRRRIVAA
jgi:hypothetical protein